MEPEINRICVAAVNSHATTSRGGMFFKNLSNDIVKNRLSIETVRSFFSEYGITLKSSPSIQCLELISGILSNGSYDFLGPETEQDFGLFTTTISFDSLINYYLDSSKIMLPRGLSPEMAVEYMEDEIPNLLIDDAEFRGGKEILWLAPLDDIEEIAEDDSYDVNMLRSYLGLAQFLEDQYLLTILFSNELVTDHVIRRPTSFDAGANIIFRTDGTDNDFGYTVNMTNYENGAREFVSGPVLTSYVVACRGNGELSTIPNFDYKKLFNGTIADLDIVFTLLEGLKVE